MSYTLNKIIDNIVYNERYPYPTHQEIINWGKQFNEYEVVIKVMQEHNLCTVTNEVKEVRQRNFYTAPIHGTGNTMTMELYPSGILLSKNEERIVRVHDLASTEFSRIVEQRYSSEIAAKILVRDENRKQAELDRIQKEKAEWDRRQEGAAEYERVRMAQRIKHPPLHGLRTHLPPQMLIHKPTPERLELARKELERQCGYRSPRKIQRDMKSTLMMDTALLKPEKVTYTPLVDTLLKPEKVTYTPLVDTLLKPEKVTYTPLVDTLLKPEKVTYTPLVDTLLKPEKVTYTPLVDTLLKPEKVKYTDVYPPLVDTALLKPENMNKESCCTIL